MAGAAMLLVAACGDDPLAPFEPEIGNQTDTFQFQVTALTGVTTTVSYAWQNTGTTANVNQSVALSAGAATLTIRDAAGAQVYSRSLTQNGTFQTSAGTAGGWTIVVSLANARGDVNFRVQKP